MNYPPHGPYGLTFPIQRVPGSRYVVIGEGWSASHRGSSELVTIGIHLDADDPNHVFLGPEAWAGWPNARRLSDWYNARHRKAMRLREARMTSWGAEDSQRFDNETVAMAALHLSALIRRAPEDEHQAGPLDWSPATQVWKDGERWVKVRAEDLR